MCEVNPKINQKSSLVTREGGYTEQSQMSKRSSRKSIYLCNKGSQVDVVFDNLGMMIIGGVMLRQIYLRCDVKLYTT